METAQSPREPGQREEEPPPTMTQPPASVPWLPAPGWYPAPDAAAGMWRYWNGNQWLGTAGSPQVDTVHIGALSRRCFRSSR